LGHKGSVRVLRPLPVQRHGATGVRPEVLAIEGHDFRDARAGVIQQLEQEPVPPPPGGVGCRGLQDGLDLRGGQIIQHGAHGAFVGDGQHPAGQGHVMGFTLQDKTHKAVEGR